MLTWGDRWASPPTREAPGVCDVCGNSAHYEKDLCGPCQWMLLNELWDGLAQIARYLERWAEFREYEEAHP